MNNVLSFHNSRLRRNLIIDGFKVDYIQKSLAEEKRIASKQTIGTILRERPLSLRSRPGKLTRQEFLRLNEANANLNFPVTIETAIRILQLAKEYDKLHIQRTKSIPDTSKLRDSCLKLYETFSAPGYRPHQSKFGNLRFSFK